MERVLFVVNSREFGGLETVLIDWLSGIEYSKASVALCYRADMLVEKLVSKRLPVDTIKLNIPDGEPCWKAFTKWRRVLASVRANNLILLEGSLGDLGLISILAARLSTSGRVSLFAGGGAPSSAIPSVQKKKLHYGFMPGIGLYRLKEIFEQKLRAFLLHQTFVSSRGFRDSLVSSFGYRLDRTSALYHGVDTGRFNPSMSDRLECRRALGIPQDAIVIVSHGRLAAVKRLDRILNAFAVLSVEYPDLWLLLTSYGPKKDIVEQVIAGNDAFRRVKLLNFQEDTSKILNASDIYVLASDREGFGIALVEAMSTGLISVATNCLGPADIIEDQKNGLLVEATHEGVLAGLRHAISLNPADRARIAESARRTVLDRFEISTAIRRALKSLGIPSR